MEDRSVCENIIDVALEGTPMSKASTEEGINEHSLPGFYYGVYTYLCDLRLHRKRPLFRWRPGLLLGHDER